MIISLDEGGYKKTKTLPYRFAFSLRKFLLYFKDKTELTTMHDSTFQLMEEDRENNKACYN